MARRPQLSDVRFLCTVCHHVWEGAPDRVHDCQDDWHPWRYVGTCQHCGTIEQPQDPGQRRLLKMWAKATGPKTPEGKAKVTENVKGHPTPDEAKRTRFNAMSHGLNARVAKYFPAKPGKYAACEGCEYLLSICATQVACLKRTENMMRHTIAFETKDPAMLTGIRADMQAAISAIIDDILLAIAQDGVRLVTPKFTTDKEGNSRLVSFFNPDGVEITVQEMHAHPLLRVLSELLTRNNLSLADLRMTPKVVEEEDAMQGQLAAHANNQESSLEFQKRQAEALEGLAGMIKQAREDAKRDPILVEYLKGASEGGS